MIYEMDEEVSIKMKMNLPNKLTCLRMVMVPVFVVLLLNKMNIAAGIVFIVASLTDTADGYIARKYNMVTVFGKFMDPLADKLLVCDRDHWQGVHHQRLQAGGGTKGRRHCGRVVREG